MTRFILIALVSFLCGCTRAGLSNAQPGLNVAQAALAGGMPAVALTVSDGILAKESNNEGALLCRGDALVQLNRSTDAEASYARVLTIDPGSAEAQMGMGRLRLRTAPAEAQAMFLDVLRRDPSNTAALNDLGIAYDLQSNYVSAQDAYRRALGLDPSMRAAEVNLAMSMALTGRAPEAVKMLRQVASAPDASRRIRHDFAAALALAGDTGGASRILSQDLTPGEVAEDLRAFETFGR